jgi:hypothetical protein
MPKIQDAERCVFGENTNRRMRFQRVLNEVILGAAEKNKFATNK